MAGRGGGAAALTHEIVYQLIFIFYILFLYIIFRFFSGSPTGYVDRDRPVARDGRLGMQDLIQRLRPNVCPRARTLHEGRDMLRMVVGEFDVKRRETT